MVMIWLTLQLSIGDPARQADEEIYESENNRAIKYEIGTAKLTRKGVSQDGYDDAAHCPQQASDHSFFRFCSARFFQRLVRLGHDAMCEFGGSSLTYKQFFNE